MGIFDMDDPAFEDQGLTVAEIASHTGTDPVLVGKTDPLSCTVHR